MAEKVEKGLIKGKIFCLIDTDKEQGIFNLPTHTDDQSLVIKRLQKQNNLVKLSSPGGAGFYEKTEIEDCLAPDCFFEAISDVIHKDAPQDIKELFNEYEFDASQDFSNINYDSSCFKAKSILGYENKGKLKEYLQSPSVKYKISLRYIKEDEHEIQWIEDIIKHFMKGQNK